MSDLIRRKDAVSRISDLLMIELQGKRLPTRNEVYNAINDIPSAEPERTAKVIDKSVGRHSIFNFDWIGKCEKCGNGIQYAFDYCPYCGSKLDWSDNE